MPARTVDLQLHSTHSDGTCTPTELCALAAEAELSAVALTDHDTVAGVPEMLEAGQAHGLEVLPAVELSVQMPSQGVDLLGYLIDHEDPDLLALLEEVQGYREDRTPRMLEKLESMDVPVSRDAVRAQAGGGIVGRPHIAQAMVQAGHVGSVDQAFERYIGDGKPAYVAKQRLLPRRAIQAIHEAGGLAVLAHPCFVHPAHLPEILATLVEMGLDGLEVWYSEHDASHEAIFAQMADQAGLVKTGGSDFHGENKPHIRVGVGRGGLEVPYSAVQALAERKAQRG